MERRWSIENLKFVNGVPWRKSDADPDGDGEKMESRHMTEEEIKEMTERAKWKEDMKQPHKFAIKLDDVQNHGATIKCKGCRALLMGKDAQTHTPECRNRFEKAMADDERVKSSKKREMKFYERAVSEGDKRRKKEGGEDSAASQGLEGSRLASEGNAGESSSSSSGARPKENSDEVKDAPTVTEVIDNKRKADKVVEGRSGDKKLRAEVVIEDISDNGAKRLLEDPAESRKRRNINIIIVDEKKFEINDDIEEKQNHMEMILMMEAEDNDMHE